MKKTLILLFLTVNVIVAQNITLNNSNLKPGIYLSLENIINNQPVEYSNLKVGEKEFEYRFKKTLKYNNAYYLDMNEEESERVKGIWGFCDGKNIYLSAYPKSHPSRGYFYKVDFIGDFIYYEGIILSNNSGFGSSLKSEMSINLIDLNKRKFTRNLTLRKFKKTLSSNPALLKEFKKEKKKYLLYRECLAKL